MEGSLEGGVTQDYNYDTGLKDHKSIQFGSLFAVWGLSQNDSQQTQTMSQIVTDHNHHTMSCIE